MLHAVTSVNVDLDVRPAPLFVSMQTHTVMNRHHSQSMAIYKKCQAPLVGKHALVNLQSSLRFLLNSALRISFKIRIQITALAL